MTAITRTDDMDDAADSLGSNKAIVQFAHNATVALARLVDWVTKAVRGINVALRSLELVQTWGQVEAARSRLEKGPSWLDSLLGRSGDIAERQREFDQATKAHIEASEAVIEARRRLAGEGEQSWEDMVNHTGF